MVRVPDPAAGSTLLEYVSLDAGSGGARAWVEDSEATDAKVSAAGARLAKLMLYSTHRMYEGNIVCRYYRKTSSTFPANAIPHTLGRDNNQKAWLKPGGNAEEATSMMSPLIRPIASP